MINTIKCPFFINTDELDEIKRIVLMNLDSFYIPRYYSSGFKNGTMHFMLKPENEKNFITTKYDLRKLMSSLRVMKKYMSIPSGIATKRLKIPITNDEYEFFKLKFLV